MKRIILIVVIITMMTMGCKGAYVNAPSPFTIRKPSSKSVLDLNNPSFYQLDYRNDDVRHLSFESLDEIDLATFNTNTIWSMETNKILNPQGVLENGKPAPLGISVLHQAGIDGRGINVAIIDDEPLLEHEEYKESIKWYKEINTDSENYSGMHSTAVISLLAGKTIGLAPGVNVYYVARDYGDDDFNVNAKAIHDIVDFHLQAKEEDKISLISMSTSWNEQTPYVVELKAAVSRAEKEGIKVISLNLIEEGYRFNGVNVTHQAVPCGVWRRGNLKEGVKDASNLLLIPNDGRTAASPESTTSYTYYGEAGWSWAIPYISGAYALALQVDQNLSFDEFWKLALITGSELSYEDQGVIGKIISPSEIIDKLTDL